MEENKNLIVSQPTEEGITIFASKDAFELGQRMAQVFSSSTLVPAQYQNNIGNCMIALNMAHRMKADPLMVMQNLVIVKGKPTFEAKFAIACFNATGKYTAIKYRETGEKGKDSWGMVAYAIEKTTGDVCEGPEVTIQMAKDEGWFQQNPKWRNMPGLMLRYRSASYFIRTTDPGVMMGFQTREEMEDVAGKTDDEETIVIPAEANAETLDMPKAEDDAPKQEDNTQATGEQPNAEAEAKPKDEPAEAKPKEEANGTKPMGKQKTPDIFGGK